MAATTNVAQNTFLTDYVRGLQFQGHIAGMLFPDVVANFLEGSYWNRGNVHFGSDDTHGPYSLDQPYLQYEWQIDKDSFEIKNYGYVSQVTDLEQAGTGGLIDLARAKMDLGMDLLMTQRELVAKNIFYKVASYPTGHKGAVSTKWNASGSDPRKDVYNAMQTIRKKIGARANAIVMSEEIYFALLTNKALLDSYENVLSGTLTHEMLAVRFRMPPENIYVGSAIYNAAKKGQAADMQDVWGEKDAIVFYKDDSGRSSSSIKSGFTACFKLAGWENERVTQWEIGNPPGTQYIIQNPYEMKALDYNAAVILEDVI